MPKFQLKLDGEWRDYTGQEQETLKREFMNGKAGAVYQSRGQNYYCDFKKMIQRNVDSGKEREIRMIYDDEPESKPWSHEAQAFATGPSAAYAPGAAPLKPVAQPYAQGAAPPYGASAPIAQPVQVAQAAPVAQPVYAAAAAAPVAQPVYAAAAPVYNPGGAPAYGAPAYGAPMAQPAYAVAQPVQPAYAGPAYAQPAYGAPAYGAPAPQYQSPGMFGGGGGSGMSPMTAGLLGAGAGLIGGMLLEEALDRPEVVVVEDSYW